MNTDETPPIVLFTNSPYMGGMEEHVLMLGAGLVHRGFKVAAICSPRDAIRPLRDELEDAGVRVHGLAERRPGRDGAWHRLRALVATLKQYPRCILHLHLTGHAGGGLVQLAGQLAGARAILRTEHLPPVLPLPLRERLGVRLQDRWLDRIICVSEQTRRYHIERLRRDRRKCLVVPNCVDLQRFSTRVDEAGIRAELGIAADAPLVCTVSRLGEHRKGIAYFLEMAAIVAAADPRARFLVVGDGSLRPDLERQAKELGIADRVLFTGERRDVPRILAATRVFVMPSLYEGGPYTVLEAMAMARPVVATPVGLVPDVIEDGVTGRLVPMADSDSLARAVLDLLQDDALADRLGRQGCNRVTERFSLEAMINGIVGIYQDVA